MTFHNKQIHIIVFLFVILMCFLIGFKIYQNSNQAQLIQNQKNNLFNSVEHNALAKVTKYSLYGTHLNIEGSLNIIKISGINITNVDFVLNNLKNEEIRDKI